MYKSMWIENCKSIWREGKGSLFSWLAIWLLTLFLEKTGHVPILTAFLIGLLGVYLVRLLSRCDREFAAINSHLETLWEAISDPADLACTREASKEFHYLVQALLEGKIKKGSTFSEILQAIKSAGVKGSFWGTNYWKKEEIHKIGFQDLLVARPTPANRSGIPTLWLSFRTADQVLVDWKTEYHGELVQLNGKMKRLMKLRDEQPEPPFRKG